MDYEALKVWVDVLQFAIIGAVGLWSFLLKKNDTTVASVAAHAERLSTLEAQIEGVPGHDDIAKLRTEMSETRAAVERVVGGLEQISKQLSLINEHLLNRAA